MLRSCIFTIALLISLCCQNSIAGPVLYLEARGDDYHGTFEQDPTDRSKPFPFVNKFWVNLETCGSPYGEYWSQYRCSIRGSFETRDTKYDAPWGDGWISLSTSGAGLNIVYFSSFRTDEPPPGTGPTEVALWGWQASGNLSAYWDLGHTTLSDLTKGSIHHKGSQELNNAFMLTDIVRNYQKIAEAQYDTLEIRVIPEPSTYALFIIGILGLMSRQRKTCVARSLS